MVIAGDLTVGHLGGVGRTAPSASLARQCVAGSRRPGALALGSLLEHGIKDAPGRR
jgi:hypothetical protein